MPSKSPAQARLMAGVAHDPAFAKKVGISQRVGREFNQADKGTGIMNKSYEGKTASYASGGAVLGKTSEFLKTEDQFRATYHKDPEAGADKPYGKTGPNAGKGEVKPPAAKDKSLKAIKPRS